MRETSGPSSHELQSKHTSELFNESEDQKPVSRRSAKDRLRNAMAVALTVLVNVPAGLFIRSELARAEWKDKTVFSDEEIRFLDSCYGDGYTQGLEQRWGKQQDIEIDDD